MILISCAHAMPLHNDIIVHNHGIFVTISSLILSIMTFYIITIATIFVTQFQNGLNYRKNKDVSIFP